MKIKTFAFFAVLSFLMVNISAKPKELYKVSVQEKVKLNKYNKQLGYQLINNGDTVVFVFDAKSWKVEQPKRVFVEGSFNGWSKKSVNWELAETDEKVFMLECEKIDVQVPGNSGYPEFRFIVHADVPYNDTVCGQPIVRYKPEILELEPISRLPGYQMASNCLILFPSDEPGVVVKNAADATKVKKLKDFDLSKPADVAAISNFRKVPGTENLYRGYHPYKISRGKLDTEKTRLQLVVKQLKEKGIKTIITLSGDESLTDKEQLPVFVTEIRRNKSELFVETDYNTVYYNSTGKEFGRLMGEIISYINSHEGPYYVHCRLGTDRTGVVCAYLAALCGANWQEIAEDYQKSNNMFIQEFRDARLLKHSFNSILGVDVSEVSDLQKEISQYFIERKIITREDFELLKKKLQ